MSTNSNSPLIFILSWQRPLYLWACLDALYRNTRAQCRFVLADNASDDPLVLQVIHGFERRGMFHAVHRYAENSPHRIPLLVREYWESIGDCFFVVESDTVVADSEPCWATRLLDHAASDPALGMIGSMVDKRDFVDPERALRLFPELGRDDLNFLIKTNAPMREFRADGDVLSDAHNPAGRLLLIRKSAYSQVGYDADSRLHGKMQAAGWGSKIATNVLHRHLSLLNIFDYPEYDRQSRDDFFRRMKGE